MSAEIDGFTTTKEVGDLNYTIHYMVGRSTLPADTERLCNQENGECDKKGAFYEFVRVKAVTCDGVRRSLEYVLQHKDLYPHEILSALSASNNTEIIRCTSHQVEHLLRD